MGEGKQQNPESQSSKLSSQELGEIPNPTPISGRPLRALPAKMIPKIYSGADVSCPSSRFFVGSLPRTGTRQIINKSSRDEQPWVCLP